MGRAVQYFAWPQVAAATFLRDLWIATSYRVGFLVTIGGSVLNTLNIFFLSRAVGGGLTGDMADYGGSYFGFALVGVSVSSVMAVGLTAMSARIREGQMMGTLELMLLSPNPLGVVMFSSALWAHAQALVTLLAYVSIGAVLGVDLTKAHVPMALLGLAVAVISFNALGLIAASFVIVIKQGNPVALLLGFASLLLSGVLYPTGVLPQPMQAVGHVLPLTHALEVLRRSVLQGEGLAELWPAFLALTALTAVLVPVGLWASRLAVRVAQTDGSLSQY